MKKRHILILITLILSALLVFSGCTGKGSGGTGGTGSSSGTTVISGKVTLSGSVSKPQLNALFTAPSGKPGSKSFLEQASKMPVNGVTTVLNSSLQATALSNAKVELFDADHPEWLYPIAIGQTDGNGDYTLSSMSNAANNPGATYIDGDPIPAGKYTLVAYKAALGQKPQVAVQTVVTDFSGAISNIDFEVLPSDVPPSVITMFGARRNTDGTNTWGIAGTTVLPATAAIQITFSMPMSRDSLEAVEIESATTGTVPAGQWSLSADWLTATYYLLPGQQFAQGNDYTVTLYGADDTQNKPKVTNVYGNPLDDTAVGTFTAGAPDTMSPTIQWNSPSVIDMGTSVKVTQAFRVESNEILDVNGMTLVGSPSLGAKPGVIYLGKNSARMYVYEFVLGDPLILNQTYSLKVYGGKDLSGNPINVLTGTIKTKTAAESTAEGIDPAATPEMQNFQAKVSSVFGHWSGHSATGISPSSRA